MPLWTYNRAPILPELDREYPPGSYIAATNRGWEIFIPNGGQEILVAINNMDEKHDVSASNLELEDGMDFMQEDDTGGEMFILLE
jgi:hypothetical protein